MLDIWIILKDRIQGKAKKGQRRSSKWRKLRLEHLKENPRCAICNGKKKIEVHHIIPFNVAPDMELNLNNLMTLCESKKYGINCHQNVGHNGNYRKFNPNVIPDAMYIKYRLGK